MVTYNEVCTHVFFLKYLNIVLEFSHACFEIKRFQANSFLNVCYSYINYI
jgi:hypothetical protein